MYLSKIEEFFFKYRKQGTLLSPRNWLIAERWEQMGIPIDIVCKGIKKTCQRFRSVHAQGEERIDILTYCEPEILKLWKDYQKALLGSRESDSQNSSDQNTQKVSEMVRKRLSTIRENLRQEIVISNGDEMIKVPFHGIDWSKKIDNIEEDYCEGENPDIDLIEKVLSELDMVYLNNVIDLLPQAWKDELKREAEEELLAYKAQMDKESYLETLELSKRTMLREKLKLKRVSLYAT